MIRAFELKIGDSILMFGITHEIKRIDGDNYILQYPHDKTRETTLSVKSRQWIDLIIKK
jgi:hypothetical protein